MLNAESIISSDELVKGAVMFGTGHPQNGVLIEPAMPVDPEDSAAVMAFLDAIWSITVCMRGILVSGLTHRFSGRP
jgi:hypothetical protein